MNKKKYGLIFASFVFQSCCLIGTLSAVDTIEKTRGKEAEFRSILKYYQDQLKSDPRNIKLILAIAEAYYTFKDYSSAIEYYTRALALDPNNIKIKILLAQSYLAYNDLAKSSQLFDEIAKVDPRDPEVLGALGRIQSLKHNLPEAENYYQRSLDLDPRNFGVLYYLGELRIEQRRFAQAQEILENLLQRDPQATWVVQALERAKQGPILDSIRQLVDSGDYKEALKRYKEQIAINPKNVELYIEFGRAYTLMHNYKSAIKVYKQGLKENPDANRIRLAAGYAYIADKNYAEAQLMLESALRAGTDNTESLAGLGRIAALEGNSEKAEDYYNHALAINPNSTLTLSYLADLRLRQKKYAEAQLIYEKILMIDPKATWVRQVFLELKFGPILEAINQKVKEGRYQDAEDLYKQLIALAPDNIDNYINFAKFYISQKQYAKAIAIYADALEVKSGKIQIYVDMGYAYIYNMQLDYALQTLKYVLEQSPENSEAVAGIGRINALIGNPEGAKNYYRWALSLEPKNMAALSFYSDLELEQKHYAEAQNLFKRILEVDPTAAWAKQSMQMAQFAPAFEEIKALVKAGDVGGAIARKHP